MAKRKKTLNLAIDLLKKELQTLENQIKQQEGILKDNIELKEQIIDAIANLQLCSKYNIYADKVKVVELAEEGSEGYFTEYKLVDEEGIDDVPEWAIKKNKKEDIALHCFDLIITK